MLVTSVTESQQEVNGSLLEVFSAILIFMKNIISESSLFPEDLSFQDDCVFPLQGK